MDVKQMERRPDAAAVVVRPTASARPVATTVGGLTARDRQVRRLAVVAGPLDPDNPTLLRHLPGVRRVLVVAPDADLRGRLTRYLEAQCHRGLLEGYHVVAVSELIGPPLAAVTRLAEAAVTAGLGRRDAFVVAGRGPGVDEALVAAAMLRRHTLAVRVVTDPPPPTLTRGDGRTSLAGGIAVRHRQVTVLVDGDVLTDVEQTRSAGPPTTVEHVAQHTLTYHVEVVHGVFGPVGRSPGHRNRVPATDRLAAWLPGGSRVLAVVDAYSAQIVGAVHRYLRRQQDRGRIAGFTVLQVASSPSAKTLSGAGELVRAARRMDLGSRDRMLAVGGGTVLDLTGVAALVYEGATPYLRIPTTLIGMIDAGVGLKVGVDVNGRKNLLGGYHPPLACLCDDAFLATLPEAEIRCGLAEAIKIAMVTDSALFAMIERHWRDVIERRRGPAVRWILERSIRAMLAQLATNPFEHDLRRLPDFGHEYGHLLESASGYRLRHGEAVSVGMAIAGELGVLCGRVSRADQSRMLRLLRRVGLPTFDPLCEPDRLWHWLRSDICAHKGGAPHLVVPTAVGAGGFIDSVEMLDPAMLRRTCAALSGGMR